MTDITSFTDSLVNPLSSLNVSYIDNKLTNAGGGDAHFFEESIHPNTIKTSLSSYNTGSTLSVTATASLLQGMKWLLAMMSKGRDVSSFFSDVVKLVSCSNMEIKKMTYMYLVEYADYSTQCREMALLSINSFQRGLADAEQLIRALALRVLTCIRVPDILQIQILAVRKCIQDNSPYVRKCAANSISKLHYHILAAFGDDDDDDDYSREGSDSDADSSDSASQGNGQKRILIHMLENLLNTEMITMVLSSAMTTFVEICPQKLDLLHGCYRKLCHLLTDMDEWGQIVTIDVLTRYCRSNFVRPKDGSAEKIDALKRRQRKPPGTCIEQNISTRDSPFPSVEHTAFSKRASPTTSTKKPKKKEVVRKGFYSDDEDEIVEGESSEEDFAPDLSANPMNANIDFVEMDEDEFLDEDHRLLVQSALPLLKSRNSGVVLAVCSLQYHCGVSSIKVRAAFGKALVRIHRDNREIQFVVLNTIRDLCIECPSAFSPFLADFFVKATDPSFTRLLKLDILVSLSLDQQSLAAVLAEIRTYIRHNDKTFVRASIRAIGRIALSHMNKEFDSHSNIKRELPLDCLSGLLTLTAWSKDSLIVGECVSVICSLLQMSHLSLNLKESLIPDPNKIKKIAMQRIIVLLVRNLAYQELRPSMEEKDEDDVTDILTPEAVASSLWILGEWLVLEARDRGMSSLDLDCDEVEVTNELLRLVAKSFSSLQPIVRLQGLHLASKLFLSHSERKTKNEFSEKTRSICEYILRLGQHDADADVRDRARFENSLVGRSNRSQHDMIIGNLLGTDNNSVRLDAVNRENEVFPSDKQIFLQGKPMPNFWPFERSGDGAGRFGSLSNVVGHRAGKTYIPLPEWAIHASPTSLRDPKTLDPTPLKQESKIDEDAGEKDTFYEDDSSSGSSSETSYSESSDSSDDESSEEGESSSSSSSDDSIAESSEQSSSDDSSSDSSSSGDDFSLSSPTAEEGNLIPIPDFVDHHAEDNIVVSSSPNPQTTNSYEISNLANQFQGLVMPSVPKGIEVKKTTTNLDDSCSIWYQLLRPELSSGLSVVYRFIRGDPMKRELGILRLPVKTSMCVQIKFVNKRSDGVVLRHVRILQRGGLGVNKIVLPSEISKLEKNQGALSIIGIDFGPSLSVSGNRISVKFDIKTGAETYSAEIKPPMGEVLRSSEFNGDFDRTISGLTGFQRSSFNFSGNGTGDQGWFSRIPSRVLKHVNLTQFETNDRRHLFAAKIPNTNLEVYVVLEKLKATIFCEHALVLNSMVGVLKKAINQN